ncbi:hypothetical protein WME89_24900 [Sorangium sp. So ce321]|uniref:hypothetical protein n=1 Tax=Sorangium sp. So ce321 TaxID=3133300 RepID=UPI003F5E65DA
MRRTVGAFALAFMALGCQPSAGNKELNTPPPTAPPRSLPPSAQLGGSITLKICSDKDTREQDRGWKTPLLSSFGRLVGGILNVGARVSMRIGPCTADFQVPTCHAFAGEVMCRENFIARVLQAAAWGGALSAVATRRHAGAGDWYDIMARVGGGDLFELVAVEPDSFDRLAAAWEGEGAWRADELHTARDLVERIRHIESKGEEPSGPEETIAHRIYITTAGHLVSFIYGHEMSHYFSNDCMFSEPSRVEAARRIEAMHRLQVEGPLCSSMILPKSTEALLVRPEELKADTCALRGMAYLERRLFSKSWGTPEPELSLTMAFVARRLVVDVASWFLAYGPMSRGRADFGNDGNPTAILLSLVPGYLVPQHRLALIARELGEHAAAEGRAPPPVLCEDAARIFVLQTRRSVSACRWRKMDEIRKAERALVPALSDFVPSGVLGVLRTGNFDHEHAFRCQPPLLEAAPNGAFPGPSRSE